MSIIKKIVISIIIIIVIIVITLKACIYQRPDINTDMSVVDPKFDSTASPIMLFDAGHGNFHSIHTTYKPFATLLENDGIVIREHLGLFTDNTLKDIDLLVIANATESIQEDSTIVTFSDYEIRLLADWVQKGGSLLLIADHDPFGSAASKLASIFGVGMASVWTVDTLRTNPEIGKNTWLEYTRDNNGLGQHAILNGDSKESTINRIITFTGQSLSFDSKWSSILKLSNSAQNYYTRDDASIASIESSSYFTVPSQSQMIARDFGNGRIVIAGEAAMFTAQVVRVFSKTTHAGFNYQDYDNKKLVLNTIHWLLFKID